MKDDPRVMASALQAFTSEVFEGAGLPSADASLVAEVLVWANLRGIDSHGVLRIPTYLEWIASGEMNPHPKQRLLHETPAILHMDTNGALGPVGTVPAMHRVIDKARAIGIGWAVLSNITHQGAMGYYTLLAAEAGMAGIAICCSRPNMAPFGARAAGVHNSPIAIAVPTGTREPLVLDMATSITAGGKLSLARDKRQPLKSGWALDTDGKPTTSSNTGYASKILVPASGAKGSGLALMFECLTSLVAGQPLLIPALRDGPVGHRQNSIVAAIDIAAFTNLEDYRTNADELIRLVKGLPLAAGFDEIMVPGEPEQRSFTERSKHGIPLPPGTVESLQAAAQQFSLQLPAPLTSG